MTLYRETPCEHVSAIEHVQDGFDSREPPHNPPNHMCPGGSREMVTINYEAAAQAVKRHLAPLAPTVLDVAWHSAAHQIVNAALGIKPPDV